MVATAPAYKCLVIFTALALAPRPLTFGFSSSTTASSTHSSFPSNTVPSKKFSLFCSSTPDLRLKSLSPFTDKLADKNTTDFLRNLENDTVESVHKDAQARITPGTAASVVKARVRVGKEAQNWISAHCCIVIGGGESRGFGFLGLRFWGRFSAMKNRFCANGESRILAWWWWWQDSSEFSREHLNEVARGFR